jgi:hypothetical protein
MAEKILAKSLAVKSGSPLKTNLNGLLKKVRIGVEGARKVGGT